MPIYFSWFITALLSVSVVRTITTYRKVGAFLYLREIDSMTMSAPWTRVNFGGANQPKSAREKGVDTLIIGADYHPGFQQIAFVDTETGELQERRLQHREEAEKFYRDLAAQGMKLRVGMEASGHARCFERLPS